MTTESEEQFGLSLIRKVRLCQPRRGVAEAWLKLGAVSDIAYLRNAMASWSSWSASHHTPSPLFNWVSISNFNTAAETQIYCLDSRGELIIHDNSLVTHTGSGPEALMFVRVGHVVHCDSGHRKPVVYVGFLEVAPWNHPKAPGRFFRAIGPLLLRAARELSEEQGYNGRLGLHAVTNAVAFYRRVGFQIVDCPNEYNELYMELGEEGAQALTSD